MSPLLEADPLQRPLDPPTELLGAAQLAPQSQVLGGRQQRIERDLLRHDTQSVARPGGGRRAVQPLAEEFDRARVEAHSIGDGAHEGRLTGTVRAEESEPLAGLQGQRRFCESLRLAEPLVGALHSKRRDAGHPNLFAMPIW